METNALPAEALEQLLAARSRFLAFLRSRVGSEEEAEDILQEAFLRSLERGGALRDEESAVAWFYRVLRNAIIDHYRRKDAGERALEHWKAEFATETLPEGELRNAVCSCLASVIETLKPEYRDALRTVDLKDGTLRALATHAGISEGNAAVRLHRARAALKRQLRVTCQTCAEDGCSDCRC